MKAIGRLPAPVFASGGRPRGRIEVVHVATVRRTHADVPLVLSLLLALACAFAVTTSARVQAERAAAAAGVAREAAAIALAQQELVTQLYREQAATRAAVVLGRAMDRADVAVARGAVHDALDRLATAAANRPVLAERLRRARPEIAALEAVFARELRFVERGERARAMRWFARDRVFAEWTLAALDAR